MKKNVVLFCLLVFPLTACSGLGRQPVSNSTSSIEKSQSSQSTQTSNDKQEVLATYDALFKEAKELNIEGKFKESELKLAAIPISALGNTDYAALKEAVEKLSNSNNQGLQKQNETKAATATTTVPQTTESGFVGDLAKWANTYVFYYSQKDQKQSRLTLAGNGAVTQSNYDGTQYFGTATITPDATNVLSYTTDTMYPSSMPTTKAINANVKLVIQWDNGGGSQTFYGYLSNSSRLALTDGISQNGGIHEVWVTY